MKRFIAAALVVASTLPTCRVFAQAPSLTYAVPAAIVPGQATDVTWYGGNLAGPTGIWCNIPAAAVELTPGIEGNGSAADHIAYRFTTPAETPVGVYAVRLATGQGLSSLRLIMVDDLSTVTDNGSNKTVETAQQLTLPVAVDGACEAESYDFYKFTAVAGQSVSVEAVSRRLGSAMDPVIRLLDSAGRELAYSDDEEGLGADGYFAHRFAEAGDYFVEIRDMRYQGGHRYRLRLGDFPLVTTTFPLAAQLGSSPKLAVAGTAIDAVLPFTVSVPRDWPGSRLPVGAKYSDGQGSALLTLAVSNSPEQVELEPNDAPETASPVSVPGAVSARFEVADDRDYFQLQAAAGQRLLIRGRTRSLGSPTDLFLRLYKADGSLLVEAEDSGIDEGLVDYTFPEEGMYRLMVEDLHHRGGPDHAYRIVVEPYSPGFTLAVEADKFDVPQGGVFVAKVTSARRDYNGPITLSIAGAGDGFTLANNVIPEGQNEVVMSVTAPAGLAPGPVRLINIVGQAKIGEADFTANASTLTPLRALLGALAYPPADLDGSIGLGVGPVFPDFFQLAADPVIFPQVAGAASFPVKATKLNGFDDPITLAVDGLPAGVTATVAPIEKGQAEVAVQLAGPGALAEGDYPFRVIGSATFQNQPRQVVLDSVLLRVVKPLEVTAAPAGPVTGGATQKIKITLTRHAGATGAVTVRFKDLPAGVTAPAELTIAEGANEVEADLTAAAGAPPGAASVKLVAGTTINGRTVTVESLPVAFEVIMP